MAGSAPSAVRGRLLPNQKRRYPIKTKLITFIVCCALLWWWWHTKFKQANGHAGSRSPPSELIPFRTPGGILHTNGFIKTEDLRRDSSSWRGTTSSGIRLNATYRYEIELRRNWNIHIDDTRKVVFVVAPAIRPQVPVAVDSRTVYEWTESGWARFDKWDNLQTLRSEVSHSLEKLAASNGYIEVARGQARITVEEFVADWLLKQRNWPANGVIKVYFADEPGIHFPGQTTLKDFLPQ